MQTQNLNAAHSLYVIYETLPEETQQVFLLELIEKQKNKLKYLLNPVCENQLQQFEDLEESAIESFKAGWDDIQNGRYHPISTLWDDIENDD